MATGLLFMTQPAAAKMAPPLSRVQILKVASNACGVEDVSDGRAQTQCNHGGPSIKVFVLELGYGGQPTVALDGVMLNGGRTPVCQNVTAVVPCPTGGTVIGYVYIFDLSPKQEGTFTFLNTSLNPPRNSMATQIYIK